MRIGGGFRPILVSPLRSTSVGASSTLSLRDGIINFLDLSPDTDFGKSRPGVHSLVKQFDFINLGPTTLTISAMSLTGGDFSDTSTCGATLDSQARCLISIQMTPTALGVRSGTLSISTNGNPSLTSLSLTGQGVIPAVTLSAPNVNFGNQGIGTSSAPQTVTLTNAGTDTLAITSISANSSFNVVHDCGSSLAPASNCSINITFAPNIATAFSGILTVTTDAPGSPHTVDLSGTGVGTPAVGLSTGSLGFVNRPVGSLSPTQDVTLTNTGTATLTITSIAVTGTNPGDFAQTSLCTTIAPAATCTINVSFTPSAGGARSASLTVTSNAANGPTNSVTLSGTGTTPLAVTVLTAGNGTGTVTSSPAGINCTPTCSASFASGSNVTLTATPAAGSSLISWTGCDSVLGTTCTISSLAGPRSVTATFNQTVQRAFVSATGNNANTATFCAVTAPCKTFAAAVTVVADNGEVVALNTAPYGSVTLTRSISLTAAPGVYAGISVFAGSGVTIASPGISVVLRGLTINGQGGANGILVDTPATGAKVSIENCVIANFANAGGAGVAVNAPAQLRVVNTLIRDSFDGVSIAGGATAVITGSKILENSDTGILVNGANAAIVNTVSSASGTGIAAGAGSGTQIAVTGSAITNNGTGVIAQGTSTVTLTNSMVTGNTLGLSQSGSATLELTGNNTVRQNTTPSSGTITTAPRM